MEWNRVGLYKVEWNGKEQLGDTKDERNEMETVEWINGWNGMNGREKQTV